MNPAEAQKPFVIGISCVSGAGKTFFIDLLKEKLLNAVSVLSFDDYYKPLAEQKTDENGFPNFDVPDALNYRQFVEDLQNLVARRPIVIKKYNFEIFDAPRVLETIEPAPIIIVEGIFVFHFPQVDALVQHRVFIETDMDICLSRRLLRDENERGIPAERSLYQWYNHVLPSFEKYILPHKTRCDFVMMNEGSAADNVQLLLNSIPINLRDPL